jgi:hypothetical protein
MGPDGAGLSCPGSSVVAARQSPLIRSIQDRAEKQIEPTSDDPQTSQVKALQINVEQ